MHWVALWPWYYRLIFMSGMSACVCVHECVGLFICVIANVDCVAWDLRRISGWLLWNVCMWLKASPSLSLSPSFGGFRILHITFEFNNQRIQSDKSTTSLIDVDEDDDDATTFAHKYTHNKEDVKKTTISVSFATFHFRSGRIFGAISCDTSHFYIIF